MKTLLKLLFRFHRETLSEFLVSDFFGDIPAKVTNNAVAILSEKRNQVDKWMAFQAFHLQRRLIRDPKNGLVIYGMLLQLQIMQTMLSSGPIKPEAEEDLLPASRADSDRQAQEDLNTALEGVEKFKQEAQKKKQSTSKN